MLYQCDYCSFNPRAPRGARRPPTFSRWPLAAFQSTRPSRGATQARDLIANVDPVSIHAPLAGRDERELSWSDRREGVSIHAPLAGRDGKHPDVD